MPVTASSNRFEIQKMLRDAIAMAVEGRWLIVGTAMLTAILALLALRMIEPSFTATLIVGPTAAEGLLGRGTPLPDLPSGSMINGAVHGAGEKMSYYERFLYELTSLSVANELASSPEIMRRVFEPMWNAKEQAWGPDPGLVPRLRRMLSRSRRTAFMVGAGWTRPGAFSPIQDTGPANRQYTLAADQSIATPILNSPGCCLTVSTPRPSISFGPSRSAATPA